MSQVERTNKEDDEGVLKKFIKAASILAAVGVAFGVTFNFVNS